MSFEDEYDRNLIVCTLCLHVSCTAIFNMSMNVIGKWSTHYSIVDWFIFVPRVLIRLIHFSLAYRARDRNRNGVVVGGWCSVSHTDTTNSSVLPTHGTPVETSQAFIQNILSGRLVS